jgi:hypothetical protein
MINSLSRESLPCSTVYVFEEKVWVTVSLAKNSSPSYSSLGEIKSPMQGDAVIYQAPGGRARA